MIADVFQSRSRKSSRISGSKYRYRQMLLERADEYLRNHPACPFQLAALAAASGTTARTLERLFHDAYGITPHVWARYLALQQVRKRLQSPQAHAFTVEGIARECGFRHMGRFAEYYRELFGELPSCTLSAAQSLWLRHADDNDSARRP